MDKIKVLIVDDSAFMRNLIERMIKDQPDIEIVGRAENGEEAVELVRTLNPDVVTLDIEMPKMTGLEALAIIMREHPTPVLMVSSLTEQGAAETIQALELGAIDFIPKALGDAKDNIFTKKSYVQSKIREAYKAKDSIHKLTVRSVVEKSIDKEKTYKQEHTQEKQNYELSRSRHIKQKKIVIIGSSTGGPKALTEVISKLRPNLSAPVVIAQHMPEGFTHALADRLNRNYDISVKEAENNDILKPGWVYIAKGGKHLRVESKLNKDLYLSIGEDKGESPFRPSVDVLAESVNRSVGGECLAVMLTGMGSDGSKEFKKLKDLGAYIVTQNEETCTVYGMPKAVNDLNATNEKAAITEIPHIINSMIK